MLKFAFDGICSFSIIPLKLSSYLGFMTAFIGFIFGIYIFVLKLFSNKPVVGWTSLMVAVLIIGGIQLISLGLLGEYVGRIYDEAKNRPLFIIEGVYGKK